MQIRQSVAALAMLLLAAAAAPGPAQEAKKERAPTEKMGVFFTIGLNYLQPTGSGLTLGVKDDTTRPGLDGDAIDANWKGRFDPEFLFGIRLPDRKGIVSLGLFQWDQSLDTYEEAGSGFVIGNTLASPIPASIAGAWDEDLNDDGSVGGVDWPTESISDDEGNQIGTEPPGNPLDNVLDAAEDLNNNGVLDPFTFRTGSILKSRTSIDVKVLDLLYSRAWKDGERFHLEWNAGLRFAKVGQNMDLSYREQGAFAAYLDDEDSRRSGFGCNQNIDATGDGFLEGQEGDGWGNGNGPNVTVNNCTGRDRIVRDGLLSIPVLTEEEILVNVETRGTGIRLGLAGEYRLRKDLFLTSALGFAAMSGETNWSWSSTLSRQRDAMPNFIDWDRNGDGVYDDSDFDFNGDGVVDETDWQSPCATIFLNGGGPCSPTDAAHQGAGGTVRPSGQGYPSNPYSDGEIDQGEPIPESERNTTVYTNRATLRDVEGSDSGLFTSLDLDLGVRWDFSNVASLTIGARSTRWFDVGTIRNAPSVDASELADGDLTLSGLYFNITIWPKGGRGR